MRTLRSGLVVAMICIVTCARPAASAEATTGAIVGDVRDMKGAPIAAARVTATSPSGVAVATTDSRGRFVLLGLAPDTYTATASANGYETATQSGLTVLAGMRRRISFTLGTSLRTLGHVDVVARPFAVGSTSDTFVVSSSQAQTTETAASPSGLAGYAGGSVQGTIASVPGIDFDAFANGIFRGGQVDDAVFDYDSVPIPQGLIAEPGGNVVGAQLATTGIASTTVTLAGYEAESDNALGGVVDEIPARGTYPDSFEGDASIGVSGTRTQQAEFESLSATPDLRWRYAVAGSTDDRYFDYGDGSEFLPAEAATYGLSLQTRGQYSFSTNVHDALSPQDDLSLDALVGQGTYTQYDSPYAGETVGEFDGSYVRFPGETDPGAPADFASGVRGSYDVLKVRLQHAGVRALSSVQIFQSQYGAQAGGPFWDENGYPDGTISLASQQGGRENGVGYDVDEGATDRHDLRFGAEAREDNSFLTEIVPTADQIIASNPSLFSYLAYAGDTWTVAAPLDVSAAARLSQTHVVPSDGPSYDMGAIDPHASAAYRFGGRFAFRATFDHVTVAPKPLEADRDVINVGPQASPAPPVPFVPLSPETANDVTASVESGGRSQFRLTYYADLEENRIDVLPVNFRSAIASGLAPNGVGVPTNVGQLRAHGVEAWVGSGRFSFSADRLRAFSSSASQFAYNGLNAPAVAAGHLFPIGYVPDLSSTASYEFDAGRVTIVPSLSFESGYPYGNGKMTYVFGQDDKPVRVLNDNFVDPGANYYFLQDPQMPWNAATNPYIGTMGTAEGDDPNTLRSMPQLLVDLHIAAPLDARTSAFLDVENLLGEFNPTAYQVNPYLIGPPGYAGGDPFYEAAYSANAGFSAPYTLGNGVPTNDGVHQSVPWTYGRGGYVPQSYPLGRAIVAGLTYKM